MTVDAVAGCPSCTNGLGLGEWGVGVAGFNMTFSQAYYNWQPSLYNSSYSLTNTNVTVQGTQGTVDCAFVLSTGPVVSIAKVPVVAVSNYIMTNTSWFLNEFQFYGSIGFGRPANPQNTSSTSFLSALIQNNIINSTTWSYSPWRYITIGGID
jgi:hypothetical protein